MQLEEKIISNLMFNEEFANKVIPFAKKEYFGAENGFIVDEIVSFYKEYGKVPSKDEIKIDPNWVSLVEEILDLLDSYIAARG